MMGGLYLSAHSQHTHSVHTSLPYPISRSPSGQRSTRGSPDPYIPFESLQSQVNILYQTVNMIDQKFDQKIDNLKQKLNYMSNVITTNLSQMFRDQMDKLRTRLNKNDNRTYTSNDASSDNVSTNAVSNVANATYSVNTRQNTFNGQVRGKP